MSKDLGKSTSYAYYVAEGGTKTPQEYGEMLVNIDTVATRAEDAADSAAESATGALNSQNAAQTAATTATNKATEATTAATTATTKAGEASTSASTATSAKDTAVSASQTATTKASEATTAAATAVSAKDDAVSANTAAQTAQTGAETAAASVQSSAAQIATNAADISQLKSEITAIIPVAPVNTSFFENLNYGAPQNVKFYNGMYPDTDGIVRNGANLCSIVFNVEPNTTYYIWIPQRNRRNAIETADDFVVGNTYSLITTYESTVYQSAYILYFTTGANTKKVMFYFSNVAYDYEAHKDEIIITKDVFNPNARPVIQNDYLPTRELVVEPKDTTFFDAVNYFDAEKATLYTNLLINTDGSLKTNPDVNTLVVPVCPNTEYYLYIPNNNRSILCESENDIFYDRAVKTVLISVNKSNAVMHFTTGNTARYIGVYFYSGAYDYDTQKDNIVLNKNEYTGNKTPFIPYDYLPNGIGDPLSGANVLIFGDSITDCCSLTINADNETTAYSWRNPSNRYTNADGEIVTFSMWPKILKESQQFGEIRNYAHTGASYKTQTRESGNERQNVQYQIDVAINDLDNPNNVFTVADYVPDIVIFALGTNDGAPEDTYDSAMSATVYKSDGVTINVEATISALDDTKTIASARKAFLRIKKTFPMAQIFCVLPIQRANNDVNIDTLHLYLEQMAHRYGCIIVDGAYDSGITRDFNTSNGLGLYLKDGLHPNEKGQNLMARMILTSLKAHYVPFGDGFNVVA